MTGFTIGHSITLALGSLNLIQPSSQLVEALIGYSIIIIARVCCIDSNNYKLYLIFEFDVGIIIEWHFVFRKSKFLIGLIG